MTMRAAASDASTRMRWIDGARGLGILLVVYGHAERALFSGPGAPAWTRIADRTIYAFHMPLFFLLAGLFVWPSLARGRGRFVTDKLVTIVYPYLLWSLIEGGLEVIFASRVNSPLSLHDLAMIPFAPIEQYWFLYVLALCFAGALACYPRRWTIAILAVVGLASTEFFGNESMPLRALAFFPYLAIGIFSVGPVAAAGRSAVQAGAVLSVALVIFVAGLAAGWDNAAAALVAALAGSCATVAAAVLLDRGILGASLALLGRGSLAIYVMHTIFSAGTRIAAQAAGIAVPPVVMLAVTMTAGVVGPLCVWLAAERLGLTTLLGFGRPTRRGRGSSDVLRNTEFTPAKRGTGT